MSQSTVDSHIQLLVSQILIIGLLVLYHTQGRPTNCTDLVLYGVYQPIHEARAYAKTLPPYQRSCFPPLTSYDSSPAQLSEPSTVRMQELLTLY